MDELLVKVTCPVVAATVAGSKTTLTVAVWPGARVSGKVAPEIEKPAPVRVAVLMVTDPVPVEVSVTDCAVDGVLTVTLPNDIVVELTTRVGTPA